MRKPGLTPRLWCAIGVLLVFYAILGGILLILAKVVW